LLTLLYERGQSLATQCFDVLASRDALSREQQETVVERATTSHCFELAAKCIRRSAQRLRVSQRVCTTVMNEHSKARQPKSLEELLLLCLERLSTKSWDPHSEREFHQKVLVQAVRKRMRPVVDLLLTRKLPLVDPGKDSDEIDLLSTALNCMPDIVPAVLAKQKPSGAVWYLERAHQLDQQAGRQPEDSQSYFAQVCARLAPRQLESQQRAFLKSQSLGSEGPG
jgi:hypothetical protein